jgi:predicted DNA-binding transcriptional regulator AlpA
MSGTPTSSHQSEPLAPVLLTLHAVSAYLGFNRARVYAFIRHDGFPAPLKFGKSSRWLKSQIDAWLASRVEGGEA